MSWIPKEVFERPLKFTMNDMLYTPSTVRLNRGVEGEIIAAFFNDEINESSFEISFLENGGPDFVDFELGLSIPEMRDSFDTFISWAESLGMTPNQQRALKDLINKEIDECISELEAHRYDT